MTQKQSGLPFIELFIVTAILGILAAIAVPKYIYLSYDIGINTIKTLGSSLTSANALNYSSRKTHSAKGVAVTNCIDLARVLEEHLPKGYSIKSKKVAVDATETCTLMGPSGTSATFSATGIL